MHTAEGTLVDGGVTPAVQSVPEHGGCHRHLGEALPEAVALNLSTGEWQKRLLPLVSSLVTFSILTIVWRLTTSPKFRMELQGRHLIHYTFVSTCVNLLIPNLRGSDDRM